MSTSWDMSLGAVCICVLQWLFWTGSLHGHCAHLRAAVLCEGFLHRLVGCGGLLLVGIVIVVVVVVVVVVDVWDCLVILVLFVVVCCC